MSVLGEEYVALLREKRELKEALMRNRSALSKLQRECPHDRETQYCDAGWTHAYMSCSNCGKKNVAEYRPEEFK